MIGSKSRRNIRGLWLVNIWLVREVIFWLRILEVFRERK